LPAWPALPAAARGGPPGPEPALPPCTTRPRPRPIAGGARPRHCPAATPAGAAPAAGPGRGQGSRYLPGSGAAGGAGSLRSSSQQVDLNAHGRGFLLSGEIADHDRLGAAAAAPPRPDYSDFTRQKCSESPSADPGQSGQRRLPARPASPASPRKIRPGPANLNGSSDSFRVGLPIQPSGSAFRVSLPGRESEFFGVRLPSQPSEGPDSNLPSQFSESLGWHLPAGVPWGAWSIFPFHLLHVFFFIVISVSFSSDA
jgi:hypothetical protein